MKFRIQYEPGCRKGHNAKFKNSKFIKYGAKMKTQREERKRNSEKPKIQSELKKSKEHNAEILLKFWTIHKQENHYAMDIKGTQISSVMDYKTDIRKDFRKMIFNFSIFRTDFWKESDICYIQ